MLPIEWIEKIFQRLTLVYGRDFLDRWKGIPLADVKADWANTLTGFHAQPECIAFALTSLPEGKAPTALEFRAICRKAPQPQHQALAAPAVNPAVVQAQLAKASNLRQLQRPGSKDWARRLLDQHSAGQPVRPYALREAKKALHIASEMVGA
jgi:hypothetical protein